MHPPQTQHDAPRAGTDDRLVKNRSLAWVLLSGCVVAAAWLALPHDSRVYSGAVVAAAGACLTFALVLLAVPPRLVPDRALKAILAMVTASVSTGIAFAGTSGTGLELFYLWATPYAFVFFSRRHASVQIAWAGIAYAGALATQDVVAGRGWAEAARDMPGRWLVVIGTLATVGVLVRGLAAGMREREARFRRGFEDSPFGMSLIGTNLRYLEVNDALCAILGRSRDELLGLGIEDVSHPCDREVTDSVTRNGLGGGPARQAYEKRYVRPDGREVLASVNTSVVRDEKGNALYFFSQAEDITERRANERELIRRAEQQEAVARLGHAALRETDITALMSEVVATVASTLDVELCKVLELSPDDGRLRVISGVGWRQELERGAALPVGEASHVGYTLLSERPVVVGDLAAETRFAPSELLVRRGVVSGLAVAIHGRDAPFGVLAAHTARPRDFSDDDVNFVQAVANVLSTAVERHRDDERHRRAALHDGLTGLPNRMLALDRIAYALGRRDREGGAVAVLTLDLDRFKLINDSLGHAAGDELLVALAPRLRDAVRPSDTVARFGGDEFVVVCDGLEGPEAAVAVAERLSRAVAEPVALRSGEHVIGASIGIAIAGPGRDTPESLLRDADAAMYRVKERAGGDRYELFDEQMREQVVRRVRTERELRRALEGHELRVHYQPIVDLATGLPRSVEALVRWEHPERGLIPPSEFIGIAEDTGLIADLGLLVLEQAAGQVAEWQQRFGVPLGLAVNVSGRQLGRPEFAGQVAAIAAESGLAAGTLGLEITESVLIEEADATMGVLAALRASGMRLILDDFGTGYSSLGYLKRFALDTLKIDRSFIDGLGGADDHGGTIVEAVIRMAHSLRLDVVAEGVETDAQLSHLRRLGCEKAQGYLFARPLPPADMGELLGARLAAVPA
jgi:diguanylate cyclase (GGDEF)-like protein/PAS domain S-box-containing protein